MGVASRLEPASTGSAQQYGRSSFLLVYACQMLRAVGQPPRTTHQLSIGVRKSDASHLGLASTVSTHQYSCSCCLAVFTHHYGCTGSILVFAVLKHLFLIAVVVVVLHLWIDRF